LGEIPISLTDLHISSSDIGKRKSDARVVFAFSS